MAARTESVIRNPSHTSFTSRYCAKSNVYSCNKVDMSCTEKNITSENRSLQPKVVSDILQVNIWDMKKTYRRQAVG